MIKVHKKSDPAAMTSTTGGIVISGFSEGRVMNTNDRTLALPLIELAKAAYAMILPRTFVRGRTAAGGSYGAFSQVTPEGGHWVGPDKPQPAGAISDTWKRQPGKWKVYQSPAHYRRAMGQQTKRFVLTGDAAASYQIKPIGPTRVKLLPKGKRGKGQPTNAKLMGILARRTGKSPVKPSPAEAKALGELATTLLTPQLIESAVHSQMGVTFRKKLAARQRSLDNLKRKERKARAKINQTGSK